MRLPAAGSLLTCLLLALAVLIAPAAAVEKLEFQDAQVVNVEAPEDLMISSINVKDIGPNSNLTLNLNAYGEMYLLSVGCQEGMGWWDFDVACTYPNGSVSSEHLRTWKPPYVTKDYDVVIQPYFIDADWWFDVDVYVGLRPFTASFFRGNIDGALKEDLGEVLDGDLGAPFREYRPFPPLAFSQISGTITKPAYVAVYLTTQAEFAKQQENDLGQKIEQGISEFFSWSWNQILIWTAKIPGIGPLFSETLEIVSLTVTEIYFWIRLLFFEYYYEVLLLLEFWFISDAMLHSKSLMALLKRLVQNHIKFFEGIIHLIEVSANLIRGIVHAISGIVSALKPL